MPLAVSITEGVDVGIIACEFLEPVDGPGREVHPWLFVFAGLFLARYTFLR